LSARELTADMSLRVAIGAPFQREGTTELPEGTFFKKLSLDWEWFTPDQARRLADVGVGEGLLAREENRLVAQFDPADVDVPEEFRPDESLLQERSTFDRVLSALANEGVEKQEAVAAMNRLKADRGLTMDGAAVLYAHRQDADVADLARRAREEL
jgi:Uncharacterized protein conserved in archaea